MQQPLINKGCYVLAALILILANNAFSQTQKEQSTTVQALAYTIPGFSLSGDSAAMLANMVKNYSLPSYLYATTNTDSLSTDEKKFIDSIKLYITKRYVAEIALKKLDASMTATDAEALQYYNTHKQDYTVTGKSTYIQAFVFKQDAATIEKVKKTITKLAANIDTTLDVSELKNSDYGIAIERNAALVGFANITKYLNELEPKTLSPLIQVEGNNSKSILYIIEKTENSYKPFEQVKEVCLMLVKAAKREQAMQQLLKEAALKFPIPR